MRRQITSGLNLIEHTLFSIALEN